MIAFAGALRRGINGALRLVRKAPHRTGRTLRPARRQLARHVARARASVAGVVALAAGGFRYRVPGEARECPGCGGTALKPLEPLLLTRRRAGESRYGFITGCRRCGLIFVNPLPTPDDLEKAFPADGKMDEHEPPVSRKQMQRLFASIADQLDVMNPPPGAAVLDFGCGRGGMLDTLARLGWSTAGIDPGAKVAFTRHREFTEIPGTPMFSLVVLHHVLEHVPDPLRILRQLAGATLPGGFILISVPHLDTVGEHGDFAYCIRSRTHILAYSRECLRWLLASAGFRTLETVAGGPHGKRLVVLGRREAGVPLPASPLAAAVGALHAYRARYPDAAKGPSWLPVRWRVWRAGAGKP